MREVDDFEKNALHVLTETGHQSVATLFQDAFPNFDFLFSLEGSINILTMYSDHEYELDDFDNIRNQLVSLIVLLNLLESEFLISINQTLLIINMEIADSRHDYPVKIPVTDQGIVNLLFEKWNYSIFCSSALKTYVKNNFRSDEELRHRRSMIWTRASFFVALIAASFAMFTAFSTKFCNNTIPSDSISPKEISIP